MRIALFRNVPQVPELVRGEQNHFGCNVGFVGQLIFREHRMGNLPLHKCTVDLTESEAS